MVTPQFSAPLQSVDLLLEMKQYQHLAWERYYTCLPVLQNTSNLDVSVLLLLILQLLITAPADTPRLYPVYAMLDIDNVQEEISQSQVKSFSVPLVLQSTDTLLCSH